MYKIGLIINPVAGVGGKAGLKGSDGEIIQKKAREEGIVPESHKKAKIALDIVKKNMDEDVVIYTCKGKMGEETARELGFKVEILCQPEDPLNTTPEDTKNLATKILREGVDLLMFAGGDGTARNVYEAVDRNIPVVGVPAGVKIHSGVYAVNPASAGWAAVKFLSSSNRKFIEAEVMDLDEDLYRQGIVSSKLYGYMIIPDNKKRMQTVKSRSHSENAVLDYIATDIIEGMEPDVIYIIGAGTTTRNIMEILKLEYTLIGVDAVCNKKLIGKDLNERRLWELIQGKKCKLVITAIGGQGHIFGRGNQQISPRIIQYIGKENIIIIATKEKLLSIEGRKLLVDTGDEELDERLSGCVKVVTGLDERTICTVATHG